MPSSRKGRGHPFERLGALEWLALLRRLHAWPGACAARTSAREVPASPATAYLSGRLRSRCGAALAGRGTSHAYCRARPEVTQAPDASLPSVRWRYSIQRCASCRVPYDRDRRPAGPSTCPAAASRLLSRPVSASSVSRSWTSRISHLRGVWRRPSVGTNIEQSRFESRLREPPVRRASGVADVAGLQC